jgi:hypothetical protein
MVRVLRRQAGEQNAYHARGYHTLGFNVLALDGHKTPLTKWKSNPDWTARRQTAEDVNHLPWRKAHRVAAICGAVSGHLCCVDFDKQPDRSVVDAFLVALGLPPDYVWCEPTPGGGWHVWLRCPDLVPPDDTRGGKVDRSDRTQGRWTPDGTPDTACPHTELRWGGVLTTLYFDRVPDHPPATVSGPQLDAAYSGMTLRPPRKPRPEPARRPDHTSQAGTWEHYLHDEFEPRVPPAWFKGARNSRGFHKNVPCPNPHHEDRNPSFGYNPESRTGYCFVCGPISTGELADLIGAPQAQLRTRYERPPDLTRSNGLLEKENAPDLLRTLPHTITRRLIEAGLHNAVLVLANGGRQKELTRRTYDAGLKQITGVLRIGFVHFETPISAKNKYPFQNVQNSSVGGRPARTLALLPPDQVLDRLEAFFIGRARAVRYQDAPSDVQPDFADPPLNVSQIDALNTARAGVYAGYEAERQTAEGEHMQDAEMIRQDFTRIRQGRYTVFDVPPGITSATALRRALYERKLNDHPEGIASYKLRKTAGISRATQTRYRQRYATIIIPQYVERPVACADDIQLGPRQTAELIAPDGETALFLVGSNASQDDSTREFLENHPGAILRTTRPAMEKRREKADPTEQDAYTRYSAEQRRRAKGQEGHPPGSKNALLPSGYGTAWLEKQLNWTPGADSIPRYDGETGEVFTIGQRWKLLGEKADQIGGQKTLVGASVDLPPDRVGKTSAEVGLSEQAVVALRALDGVTAEEAGRHVCEDCGRPAEVQHFTGWYCRACYAVPIQEKARRWRAEREPSSRETDVGVGLHAGPPSLTDVGRSP